MSNYLVNTLHFDKSKSSEMNEGKKPAQKLTEDISDEALRSLASSFSLLRTNLPDLLQHFRDMSAQYIELFGRHPQPGRRNDMPGWTAINTIMVILIEMGLVEGDQQNPESLEFRSGLLEDLGTLAQRVGELGQG